VASLRVQAVGTKDMVATSRSLHGALQDHGT